MLASLRGRCTSHCVEASATQLLQQCAGFAKKAAAKTKAAPTKPSDGDEKIDGKYQKLLKVCRHTLLKHCHI